MSSLRCKALCILIKFLILWSISLNLSFVYFKNGPKYITREPTRCSSLWWDFYCRVVFWEVFSFVWSILFIFFLSSLFVWWCPLPCEFFPPVLNDVFSTWTSITTSLPNSPGPSWVFLLILTIPMVLWSPFFLWFPVLPGFFFTKPLRTNNNSTAFFALWQGQTIYLSFCFLALWVECLPMVQDTWVQS